MRVPVLLLKLCVELLCVSAYAETIAAAKLKFSGAKHGCPTKCGNLTVPYPFGIGIQCALREWLYVTCNETFNPPKAFIQSGNIEILGISPHAVRIGSKVAYKCYSESGLVINEQDSWMQLTGNPSYTFSAKKNKFVSVGCNTVASIQNHNEHYSSGCIAICETTIVLNGSCSGIGCCHTSIPKGLKYLDTFIGKVSNWDCASFNFSPCSYAFLVEDKEFQFQASDIQLGSSFYNRVRDLPVVLDWVVENITCKEARRNITGYACQKNTVCDDSNNGPGYRCRCKDGYEGNPYLPPGCQVINECEDSSGIGCSEESKEFPVFKVTLGVISGHLLVLFASCWLYFGLKKRRVARLKRKFFKQNLRLLHQEHQISSQEGTFVNLNRIYTAEELKLATNNYDESRILGRGGSGTVYKGIFSHDGTETVVAIKKSKLVERSQIGQFINEVVILTQINHRHVVKLLGCCLETEVPLLVYEFIPNKTLHEHIHNCRIGAGAQKLSWQNRLRIAAETAGALAYLHSAASIPIIHRDVKSSNILLDDDYNTKVTDFGASKFIPLDQTHISTLVQGTLGYLDPEYFQTCELTEKSDVYSFGVILVELMTGEKAVSAERYEGRKQLATHFILSMQEKALLQIIAKHLVDEGDIEQLFAVAELALKCLKLKGEERPTMREVVAELEGIKELSKRYSSTSVNEEETRYLLDIESDPISFNPSSSVSIGHNNINNMMVSLDIPR